MALLIEIYNILKILYSHQIENKRIKIDFIIEKQKAKHFV